MSDSVIKVDNLSKKYIIKHQNQERYTTLRDVMANKAKSFGRRVLSPFLSPRSVSHSSFEEFYALKDVSFEIKRGDLVGIIGNNGAGKSTLLKILSRITEPTSGRIEITGRVASLLEVGTGFHPELTGRENIFLNGAILGMSKVDIIRKFDEIVAFAEVEKFLDTPIKRYSSGMYVRLAFAVAANLDPDILLVDEVLAVGDIQFQKKCLGKMENISKSGRTILFVSHNMGAIGRLCEKGILLQQGRVLCSGNIEDIICEYTEKRLNSNAELVFESDFQKKIQLLTVRLLNVNGDASTELNREQPFSVSIEYIVRENVIGAHVGVMLDKLDGTPICHTGDVDTSPDNTINRTPGLYRTSVEFPGNILNAGTYQIRIGIGNYTGERYDYCNAFIFHLHDYGTFASVGYGRQRPGILAIPLSWKTVRI